ncbi:aromatic acid exporter family protein [Bacillus cereus group sp. BfR-BA-01380]|uniref:FUSC family protein n=1 Tax=Bacillus cereus group sp. BfR-BA-01380 TaxID=2920324 RepID=UPI001F568073|nr:FUSC family protein [Bacillus cereus group sp. BfR-BA-01380]
MGKTSKQKKGLGKGLILIIKIALASGLSWELAKMLGSEHPYLAPLTVILSMQETVQHSAAYAFYRIIGTIFGISITVFIISHLEVNGWTIGLLLLGGMLLPVILRVHKTIIHQVALTILLVFVFVHKTNYYVSDRIRDTIIGALIAIIVHMVIFPPNYVKEARSTLNQFGFHLVQLFEKTALWVNTNCDPITEQHLRKNITTLLQELHEVQKDFKLAEKSLKLNPFTKNKKQILRQNEQLLLQLKTGYIYISNILNTFSDWSQTDFISKADQQQWTVQLQMLGRYIEKQLNGSSENQQNFKYSLDLLDLSSISVQVNISPELELYRHQLSLYNDTLKFIQEIKKDNSNNYINTN